MPDLGKFAAQVEDCDWGDAGRRRDRGGSSVLAPGRFGGFAAAQQLNQLRIELLKKNRDVTPLRGMDKKIVLAKDQIGGFYKDRFAASDSELLNELGKLASENRIRMQHMSYKEEDSETSGVIPVEIEGSFYRRLSATGAIHQHAGAVEVVYRCG